VKPVALGFLGQELPSAVFARNPIGNAKRIENEELSSGSTKGVQPNVIALNTKSVCPCRWNVCGINEKKEEWF
jgi:hypothetical protein